jgi:dihydroneopterin aldolase
MCGQFISIRGLPVAAKVGVYAREKDRPQPVLVDVTIGADLLAAAESDDLALTEDYTVLARLITNVATERHHSLIEHLAHAIAKALLDRPRVFSAEVTVHKPGALPEAADTSVRMTLEKSA